VNFTVNHRMTSAIGGNEPARRERSTGGFARPGTLWVLVCCFLASVLPAQQAAEANDALAAIIPELKAQTSISVLLPQRLPALAEKIYYAHAKGDAEGYTIRLESDADCDGANACFLGMLRAKRSGRFSFPETVKLDQTTTARFKPTSCGGSCSEAAIEWKYRGVLYLAQLNLRTANEQEVRTAMIALAKSAVRLGPR
jgi:hypothetical protein